jgi:hypothetical protein
MNFSFLFIFLDNQGKAYTLNLCFFRSLIFEFWNCKLWQNFVKCLYHGEDNNHLTILFSVISFLIQKGEMQLWSRYKTNFLSCPISH